MNYKLTMISIAIYLRLKQKKFICESTYDEIREVHETMTDIWYENY
jgi:hypothetical protein